MQKKTPSQKAKEWRAKRKENGTAFCPITGWPIYDAVPERIETQKKKREKKKQSA